MAFHLKELSLLEGTQPSRKVHIHTQRTHWVAIEALKKGTHSVSQSTGDFPEEEASDWSTRMTESVRQRRQGCGGSSAGIGFNRLRSTPKPMFKAEKKARPGGPIL